MDLGLKDKRVVVQGSSTGLGFAIASGIELCAKCSAIPDSARNKHASDMFKAFITQSQGKSTLAFFQIDGPCLIFNMIYRGITI